MDAYYQNYTNGNTQEKIALIKGLPNALSQFAERRMPTDTDTTKISGSRLTAKQMLQNALRDSSEELSSLALVSIGENGFSELTNDVLNIYNTASGSLNKRSAALRSLAALNYPQLLTLLNSILQSQTINQITSTALRVIDSQKLCKTIPNVKSLAQRAADMNAPSLKENKRPSDVLLEISQNAESVFQHLISNGPCN